MDLRIHPKEIGWMIGDGEREREYLHDFISDY
jgi:hypothetical protein